MVINTFPPLEHDGIKVIIRQFGHLFEYLFTYKNEMYTTYIQVTPRNDKFHDERDYSKDEINGSVKTMFAMARTTIAELKRKEKESSKSKVKKNGKPKTS